MIDNHARFRDLTAGAQSLALTLAVVAGGVWALFTLDAQRARGEYERLLRDLRDQRVVTFEFQSSVYPSRFVGQQLVVLTVTIANKGRTTEIINWPPVPLTLALVRETPSGPNTEELPAQRLDSPTAPEGGLRLMPGISLHRVFVATISTHGLYHVNISLPASAAEEAQANQEGVLNVTWGDDAYIYVPRARAN